MLKGICKLLFNDQNGLNSYYLDIDNTSTGLSLDIIGGLLFSLFGGLMPGTIRFGTDGWRGVIAEDYTFDNVRRCAQGFADYLISLSVQGE